MNKVVAPTRVMANIADLLGKELDFIEAIQTDFAKELLAMWLDEANRLLEKIVNEKADENEKAEFRVMRRMIDRIIDRINKFNNDLEAYRKLVDKEQKRKGVI